MPLNKGAQLFRRWRIITKKNMTQRVAAQIFDTDITRISKYENGAHLPDRTMAVHIERLTCGAVTCGMWDEEPYEDWKLDPDINPDFDPFMEQGG